VHASVRLGFVLLITITTAANAQHGTAGLSGPGPSQLWGEVAQQAVTLDSVRPQIRPTHWKEGALVGGVVTGLGLALWVDAWCRGSESSDDCGGAATGGFVLGAVLGGLTGALVGGQFPKDEDP
jgi:hypothetical protein